MEMQGSRQLAITQQQAWDALNDPAVLKTCIPGCDKVDATAENQYAIGMALKIGPVSAKFAGKITLSEIVAPASYTISFDGQGGVAGFGKGTAKVQLTPNAQGCELSYSVQASVGGKVAQLAQALQGARSVGWQSEAHADTALQSLQALLQAGASPPTVTAYTEPPLFEDVASYCDSFSQWWRKTRIAS